MSIVLWIIQALLALHTAIGAGWKVFNSEQSGPTLAGIPHALWMLLIPLELICAVGLVIPVLVPSLCSPCSSGRRGQQPDVLLAGVAAFCAVVAAGRLFVAAN